MDWRLLLCCCVGSPNNNNNNNKKFKCSVGKGLTKNIGVVRVSYALEFLIRLWESNKWLARYGHIQFLIGDDLNEKDGNSEAIWKVCKPVGGASCFDFNVDPNLDLALVIALNVFMEEERSRQEATTKKAVKDATRQSEG
ncbi:hypothetical protein ACFE04_020843 [Oxalis oulophora]